MSKLEVQIWSDVVCPWCAIGKANLESALHDFEHSEQVEVTWRSFELDPSAPAQAQVPLHEALAKKYGSSPDQIQQMMDRLTTMAKRRGLAFDFANARPGNTLHAHRLLHLAREHGLQGELKARLFRAYLGEGVAIGDPEQLVPLAVQTGLPADQVRALLDGDAYTQGVRGDQAEAREHGINGVPFFVFGGRYAVSGAEAPEVLLGALQRAWDERAEGPPTA